MDSGCAVGFGDRRLDVAAALLVERMVAQKSVCLRCLAQGVRKEIVRFGRFLANRRVSVDQVIEGWSEPTREACVGRHVLAIQDTSDINFRTTAQRTRGLGEIGRGVGRGVLLHAMVAVDADSRNCLGLVGGRIWTRDGRRTVPHDLRPLEDKESERWLATAEMAKSVLADAAMVTVVADRESDFYIEWARVPAPGFHLLTRAMHDRTTGDGGRLSAAVLAQAGEVEIALPAQPGRPKRTARLATRFGQVALRRPVKPPQTGLPKTVTVSLVEVVERDPPQGVTPLHWRLLTTHEVNTAEMARQVADWYRARWVIEQLFRTLKKQGLQLESSQLDTAEGLMKLTAIATKAACVTLQLVQARDGLDSQPIQTVFSAQEIHTLDRLVPQLEGKTTAQENPHPKHSLAWAAWGIAKLGGWDGYRSSRPPGPITFQNGLSRFHHIAYGVSIHDV